MPRSKCIKSSRISKGSSQIRSSLCCMEAELWSSKTERIWRSKGIASQSRQHSLGVSSQTPSSLDRHETISVAMTQQPTFHGVQTGQQSTRAAPDTDLSIDAHQHANEIPMATDLFLCCCRSQPVHDLAEESQSNTVECVGRDLMRVREPTEI
jgi:hypothetical protein